MGQKVSNFFSSVAKVAAKGAISALGSAVPVVGTPIANYINSKFGKGSYDVGAVDLPPDAKTKEINTPAQLISVIKQYPEQAQKAGLTVQMVKDEVKQAKEVSKATMAIGGIVKENKISFPSLGKVDDRVLKQPVKFGKGSEDVPKVSKPKKQRSQAQIEATKKLVEMNKKKRATKK